MDITVRTLTGRIFNVRVIVLFVVDCIFIHLSHIINYIMTVDGFCVQVETNDTVAILKQKVEVREGISPDQQRLIFGGRQIEDDKTMSHYGIESGATVILVLRLC